MFSRVARFRPTGLIQVPFVLGFAVLALASAAADGAARVPAERLRLEVGSLFATEYEFRQGADGSWSAPNRSHGMRVFVSAAGLRLISRTESPSPWELTLRFAGLGRGTMLAVPAPPIVDADGRRVDLAGAGVSEWFVNQRRGIKQGFTIRVPPGGTDRDSPLVVELAVGGNLTPFLSEDDQEILFRDADGQPIVRYGELAVVDARGVRTPSWFELFGPGLRIVVDDRAAVYPLEVDPLGQNYDWSAESDQVSALLGITVSGAGDVNNDGFDDVIIGADEFDNGQSSEGRVWVYFGSSTGLQPTPWINESNQTGADYGRSVASAGDVNADSFADVLVGAHKFETESIPGSQTNEGHVFVYYGSAAGLGADFRPADWWAESDQAGASFGVAVAGLGDVDNDGYDDIIIGADEYDFGQTNEGAVFVFHGSATGLDDNGQRPPPGSPITANWFSQSNQVDSDFGFAVDAAGDVDNDGFPEAMVGAWNFDENLLDQGRIYLYRGGAQGLTRPAFWTYEGPQDLTRLGISVGGAGDVNGDTFDDVIAGGDEYSNGEENEGGAFVFHGAPGGPGLAPDWIGEPDQVAAGFGFAVSSAGDVNNDGYDDVVVGADRFDDPQFNEGAAFVYLGSPTGLPAKATYMLQVDQTLANFGGAVAAAGDVNGDGFDDVIIGAKEWDNPEFNEGAVFVFYGCLDDDRDGFCFAVDCDDADDSSWETPGEVPGMRFPDKSTLSWSAATGGDPLRYDTLRSGDPTDFSAATCVEANDPSDLQATDAAVPALGAGFYYLVRAENSCAAGQGPLGQGAGGPRTGTDCP